jgi:ABC-type transporter Mla subunit MlaD
MAEITIRITDKAIKIAAAVMGAMVLALFASGLWSSGAFRPHYQLQMFVPKADGLLAGNQVRLNGMPVGSVSKLELEDHRSDPDRSIRVTLRIEKRYQRAIRSDATASLVKIGLHSDRYVNIQASRTGEPIAPGGEIRFTPIYEPTPTEVIDFLGKRFGCKGEEKTTPENTPHSTN